MYSQCLQIQVAHSISDSTSQTQVRGKMCSSAPPTVLSFPFLPAKKLQLTDCLCHTAGFEIPPSHSSSTSLHLFKSCSGFKIQFIMRNTKKNEEVRVLWAQCIFKTQRIHFRKSKMTEKRGSRFSIHFCYSIVESFLANH